MNTLMYEHPLTEQHLRTVREVIGYNVAGPIGKKLACGDIGGCSGAASRQRCANSLTGISTSRHGGHD